MPFMRNNFDSSIITMMMMMFISNTQLNVLNESDGSFDYDVQHLECRGVSIFVPIYSRAAQPNR